MNTLQEQKEFYIGVRKRLNAGTARPPEATKAVSVPVPLRRIPPSPVTTKRPIDRVFISPVTEIKRRILDEISNKFDVSVGELIGDIRENPIVLARHAAFYEMRRQGGFSNYKIGRLMNKDPTTVAHGIERHTIRLAAEKNAARGIPDF